MTKHELTIPGMGEITSVVMSPEEFNSFCDNLEKSIIGNATPDSTNIRELREAKAKLESVRKSQYCFGIQRNPATEALFLEVGVHTRLMSVCVRGIARRALGMDHTSVLTQDQAKLLIDKHYLGLTPDQKADVDQAAISLMAAIREDGPNGEPCNKIYSQFLAKYMKSIPRGLRLEYLSQMHDSVVQTFSLRCLEFEDPFVHDFDGYLRRLFTGAIVTGELTFKALNN